VPLKEKPLVDFLLVGGGLASATAAETLRAGGAEGSIAILSAEATLPYHRPPLSKDFLIKGPENAKILIHDEAYYREHDIAVHFGAAAVVTSSGKVLPCEIVAVAIGVHPETGFLQNSGIDIDGGILVNQHLETNQPGIYAAGDVANFYDPISRSRRRSEHWDNALKQGRIAAWNMLGERQSWRTVSYFFSDVFDLTFNVVGDTEQASERIVRGSIETKPFSVLYLNNNTLRGAFLLEQSFVETKAAGGLIVNRCNLGPAKTKLADSHFPLNQAALQTVLILQGGGALGAFECGVVKALEERNIHPDLIAGVSIGAINAAIVASNHGAA
jgi:NADPH-dependent 2,4-dienoyl-CoA reductase/sulfur reductase-like enzyme